MSLTKKFEDDVAKREHLLAQGEFGSEECERLNKKIEGQLVEMTDSQLEEAEEFMDEIAESEAAETD